MKNLVFVLILGTVVGCTVGPDKKRSPATLFEDLKYKIAEDLPGNCIKEMKEISTLYSGVPIGQIPPEEIKILLGDKEFTFQNGRFVDEVKKGDRWLGGAYSSCRFLSSALLADSGQKTPIFPQKVVLKNRTLVVAAAEINKNKKNTKPSHKEQIEDRDAQGSTYQSSIYFKPLRLRDMPVDLRLECEISTRAHDAKNVPDLWQLIRALSYSFKLCVEEPTRVEAPAPSQSPAVG